MQKDEARWRGRTCDGEAGCNRWGLIGSEIQKKWSMNVSGEKGDKCMLAVVVGHGGRKKMKT